MNYFAILIFLVIIISIPSVFAEGPEIYDVAISLIGIGEINKQIGSYELDFWYSIFSEDKNLLEDGWYSVQNENCPLAPSGRYPELNILSVSPPFKPD